MDQGNSNNGVSISGGAFHGSSIAGGSGAQAHTYNGASEKTSATPAIKILLVFANPRDTESLRLESEERAIQEAIQLGRHRDNIALTVRHAATIHDVRRAMLNEQFQIVHLAGHGTPDGLILENEQGRRHLVPQEALADFFRLYNETLRCVVLNACYSLSQGHLISFGVPYTIAMDGAVSDRAAIEFARGFYDTIGAGHTFEMAYEQGRIAARLAASNSRIASIFLADSR